MPRPTRLPAAALALASAALAGCAPSHPGFSAPNDAADAGDDGADQSDGTGDDGGADAPEELAWAGSVPCGATTCPVATQYCLIYVPDGGGDSTPDATVAGTACVAIPASCAATPTCACIEPTAACGPTFNGCVQAWGVAVTCEKP